MYCICFLHSILWWIQSAKQCLHPNAASCRRQKWKTDRSGCSKTSQAHTCAHTVHIHIHHACIVRARRKNFIHLRIYYRDFNIEKIDEVEAYPVSDVFRIHRNSGIRLVDVTCCVLAGDPVLLWSGWRGRPVAGRVDRDAVRAARTVLSLLPVLREAQDAPEASRVEEEDDARRQVVAAVGAQQPGASQQVQRLFQHQRLRRDVTTLASLQTRHLNTFLVTHNQHTSVNYTHRSYQVITNDVDQNTTSSARTRVEICSGSRKTAHLQWHLVIAS